MYEQEKWELRNAVGVRLGLKAEAVGLGLFPAFARRTVKVTQRRVRAFLEHLHLQLEKMETCEPVACNPRERESITETLRRLPLESICSKCRGHCCRAGGDHAYISSHTLKRSASYLGTSDGVIDRYISLVPKRAYAGSCIFHTARGCALPRELRSETCTRYFCSPLTKLGRSLVEFPKRPYVAVFEPAFGRKRIRIVRDPTGRDSQWDAGDPAR